MMLIRKPNGHNQVDLIVLIFESTIDDTNHQSYDAYLI